MKAISSAAVRLCFIAICAASAVCQKSEETVNAQKTLDFDKLWDYDNPAATRTEFEKLLPQAENGKDRSYYLQLQTQIARTYGLEAHFDSAHEVLDKVEEELSDDFPVVRVRYLLERGRTFRSSGDIESSRPLFSEAFELSKKTGEDFHTVDAAHMIAIVAEGPVEKRKWNLIGTEIAENSEDPRARGWLGSLYNNMGWDYHDEGEYDKALEIFEKALKFRKEQGKQQQINIAEWCIARTLRSLGRIDEALEKQLALLDRNSKAGTKDGYIFEELGELYLIKDDSSKAEKYFALAYDELSKDVWLARNETERLARMKKLGRVE